MKIRIFQKGFNYSQDGCGNRLVYHLQGCNMRCPWCANPEGISIASVIMVNREKLLASACPYGAIENHALDRAKCETCQTYACMGAGDCGVAFSSRAYTIDEIVNEVQKSSPMFFGGGGVTLTGGEPTLQFEAVRELLTRLTALGIHTALETNGTHPRLPEIFPRISQLIMDYKHYDGKTLKRVTGVGKQTIEQNILAVRNAGRTLLLRVPLVNGFNAGAEDIEGFARFFSKVNWPGLSVELLRYHEFGRSKWKQCGMEYRVKNGAVAPERLKAFEKGLADAGIALVRT